MISEKKSILESAQRIFLQKGFYKTPLDEIAADLKISKKTIYKHFCSKNELVRKSLLNFMETNQQTVSELVSEETNAVEKCFCLFQFLSTMLATISDHFIHNIRDYMPDLWNEVDKIRTSILYPNLKAIIEQGQREGFFIEIESELAITVFVTSIRGVLNPDVLISKQFSLVETARSIVEILLGGILTEKGRTVFENLKTRNSQ
ncbi:MAG: TetR/AcrR family transcriptional regulator [bacterium]